MESKYAKAKSQYSQSLKNLEVISEEIHTKRKENTRQRGECVGAEATTPPQSQSSRRRSTLRRLSEEKIKTALVRQRSQPPEGLWRYRHSLLLDLDVDFDIGNEEEMDSSLRSPNVPPLKDNRPPLSPGAKSVDIGCVNMKYYDDYQVLDIGPFLEKHSNKRRESEPEGFNYSVGNRVRSPTVNSEFADIQIPPSGDQIPDSSTALGDNINQRKHSHPVVVTMEDALKTTSSDRKISKPVLNSLFSVIDEDTTAEDPSVVIDEDTTTEDPFFSVINEDTVAEDPSVVDDSVLSVEGLNMINNSGDGIGVEVLDIAAFRVRNNNKSLDSAATRDSSEKGTNSDAESSSSILVSTVNEKQSADVSTTLYTSSKDSIRKSAQNPNTNSDVETSSSNEGERTDKEKPKDEHNPDSDVKSSSSNEGERTDKEKPKDEHTSDSNVKSSSSDEGMSDNQRSEAPTINDQ